MENTNDGVAKCSDNSLSSTHVCAHDYVRLNEALLTNRVMLFAYATSIVIVAVGCVCLVAAIGILWFFYPEKGTAFFNALLVVSPMMAVLIANISKIKSAAKKIAHGQQPDS